MKILYVATIGGFMPFFKSLVRQLIDEGNEVDFAANQSIYPVPSYYEEWGCKIYDISSSRSPLNFGNIKAIKQIRNIARDYDIVHCHTPLASMSTRLACRKLRKKGNLKVIYTAHGFHFYKGAPKKNWLIFYPIEKMCSRWTDVLITINSEDYELAKRKMKALRIEYVPGVGVDIKYFTNISVDKKKKREELGLSQNSYVILSVGELNENKNHEVMVKAIAKLNDPSICYVIAGEGPKKDYLNNLAKEMNVKLLLLGSRKDVAELNKMADVFAFPSHREGLGVAAIEAMAAGLPLICSNNRGTREYAFDGAILCNDNNVEEFANAILKIRNSKNCEEMKKYNTDFSNKFDIKEVNRRMKEIYLSVVDKNDK